MDIALTDFENTALTIAVGMIANVINTFDLDFIIPISLVDENMKRAHNRDGLLNTKFWWKVPEASGEPTVSAEDTLRESKFIYSNATSASQEPNREAANDAEGSEDASDEPNDEDSK